MKKQSNLSRLMEYAEKRKYLTYASWILSAASALVALIPFYEIFKIIKEVLNSAPDFKNAEDLTNLGFKAVLFAVLSFLLYIGALMCSNLSAFRVATVLRIKTAKALSDLSIGFT